MSWQHSMVIALKKEESDLQQENIKNQLRQIETLEIKLANARVAVFNKTCLNENLLPTFIQGDQKKSW